MVSVGQLGISSFCFILVWHSIKGNSLYLVLLLYLDLSPSIPSLALLIHSFYALPHSLYVLFGCLNLSVVFSVFTCLSVLCTLPIYGALMRTSIFVCLGNYPGWFRCLRSFWSKLHCSCVCMFLWRKHGWLYSQVSWYFEFDCSETVVINTFIHTALAGDVSSLPIFLLQFLRIFVKFCLRNHQLLVRACRAVYFFESFEVNDTSQ